jgi:hypothetical protein
MCGFDASGFPGGAAADFFVVGSPSRFPAITRAIDLCASRIDRLELPRIRIERSLTSTSFDSGGASFSLANIVDIATTAE